MKINIIGATSKKIGFVILLILSGCLADDRTARNLRPADHFAQVQFSNSKTVFTQTVEGLLFVDENGIEISQSLDKLKINQVDAMELQISSLKSRKLAEKLQKIWQGRGGGYVKISVLSKSEFFITPSIEVTLKIAGLKLSPCLDAAGKYKFGCAVQSNRALSLANYSDLHVGSDLGPAPAELEIGGLRDLIKNKTTNFSRKNK